MYQAPPTLLDPTTMSRWTLINSYTTAGILGLLLLHIPSLSFRFLPATPVRPGLGVALLIYGLLVYLIYRIACTERTTILRALALLQLTALLLLTGYTLSLQRPITVIVMASVPVSILGGPIGFHIVRRAMTRTTTTQQHNWQTDTMEGETQQQV